MSIRLLYSFSGHLSFFISFVLLLDFKLTQGYHPTKILPRIFTTGAIIVGHIRGVQPTSTVSLNEGFLVYDYTVFTTYSKGSNLTEDGTRVRERPRRGKDTTTSFDVQYSIGYFSVYNVPCFPHCTLFLPYKRQVTGRSLG